MRIGILTFHSQLNYGALLQAYALQSFYESIGYQVVILDRWMTKHNELLVGERSSSSIRKRLRDFLNLFQGIGYFGLYIRRLKTQHFISHVLHLSEFHFHKWSEAPADLGVDMISVGSDQVWNSNLFPPQPYLLIGAPKELKAVAYAASIGRERLRDDLIPVFRNGLGRFSAISCREAQGCRILKELGYNAEHVLDPTLIVDDALWKCVSPSKVRPNANMLVYVLAEDVWPLIEKLSRFGKVNRCNVTLLVENVKWSFPFSFRGFARSTRLKMRLVRSPVKVVFSAGPMDFVRLIAESDSVVANSYHALMFATIYRKNIRVISPQDEGRKQMHARMQEFVARFVRGPVMQSSLENALESVALRESIDYDEPALDHAIRSSRQWITRALS